MKLVLITALVAVCGAAKLDRTYLPPPSAKTAGGSAGSLQTLFAGNLLHQANGGFPKGSFTNEFQGVVVDAAAAGTRATDGETGLGAPRLSYGSTNSKVGDAAFRGTAGFRLPNTQAADVGSLDSDVQAANTRVSGVPQGFSNAQAFEAKPERAQATYDRAANTLRFEQEVGTDSYHFGFETDNGISQEENGVAANGVQAQGGYSYTGDDGQVYSVTYTADEGGYQPKGDHLPTPPPIPEEILKSLEQNARDEAAGLVDDGTYDAQKYNAGADYSESDIAGVEQNVNQSPSFGRRPVSDATASGSFINQNNQAFVRPNSNEQPGQKDESSNTQISSSNNFGPSKPNNGFAPVKQPNGLQSNEFGSRNEYKPAVQGLKQHEKTQRPENDIQQSNAVSESGSQFSTPQESQSSLPFGTSNRNIINTQSFSGSTNPSRANDIGPKANSQSSTTTFGVNAGNRFASRNEYLPPMQGQSIGPQRPSIPSISTPQQALNQISESGNFQAAGQSSVGFAPNLIESNNHVQAPQVFNTFQQKPQGFQQSRPQGSSNQFSQNSFVAQKEKTPKDKETATSPLESQRPTSVPSIELTTPLESSQPNVPTNLPSDRIPSSANTIDTQHINGRPSTQFGTQPTSNKQQARPISKIQSQVSSNGFPAHGQNQYPSSPSSPDKQRLQQNEVHQNQLTDSQYSPSTIRPSFNQQAQSVDDSYYYKQPAKPFNTPKFPNSPSGQFNGVAQQSQFSGNFQQNFPTNSFQPQRGQPNRGSTRYPEPPTLATAVPTTSFNEQFQGITTSSQSNGITQASISPFRPQTVQASSKYPKPPTVAPTAPTTSLGGFSTQNNGIIQTSASAVSGAPTGSINLNSPTFGLKPSFQYQNNQFQTSNPNQSFGQRRPLDNSNKNQQDNSQASPTPQYSGEIYEYTKPSERLPAPSKPESTSSPQQGQTQPQFEPQGNRDTQELNAQKPSRPTLGSRPQFGSQRPQFTQSTSLTAETQTQSAENSKPQFNTPIKPYGSQSNFGQAQNSHNTQELNTQQPSSPTFGARPQFGSQIPQFAQSTLVNAEAQVQTAEPSKPQFNLASRPYGSQPEYSQVQDNRNMQKMNTQQPTRPTFGARPQFGSQRPQFGQSASANAEAQVQTAEGTKTQFNVPSRPYGSQPQFGQAQDNRNTQELNTQQPSLPTFGARPQFGSQLPQFAQSTPVSAEAQVQTSEVFKSQFNVPSRAYEQEQSQRPQAPEKSKSGQNNGRPNNCCQSFNTQTSNQESQRPQNRNQGPIRPQFAQPGSQFSGFTSQGSSQFAGKGEEFGGPRKPPSFDQETGYHY